MVWHDYDKVAVSVIAVLLGIALIAGVVWAAWRIFLA